MANINFIYGNTSDTKKYETINAMSESELLSLSEEDLKSIVAKLGNKVSWGQQRECSNHWNAWIEGMSIGGQSGRLLFDVYVQGDSTDENYDEYFREFRGGYRGKSDYHGFNVQFDRDEVASVIRFLLKEFVRIKWTDREKIARAKLVSELKSYKVINPVVNEYYREYNLRHDLNKYSNTYDVAKHKSYYFAKDKLYEFIEQNAEELYGKSEEELIAIYKKEFYAQAKTFRDNFTDQDFREWRSHQWFW